MTQPAEDLAALAEKMVREMGLDSWFIQDEVERCEAVARRYMEKGCKEFTADDMKRSYIVGYNDARSRDGDFCEIRIVNKIRAERAGKDGR